MTTLGDMTPAGTALRYAAFAAIATATNLGAQWLLFRFYDGAFALAAALVLGTGVGLVTKYILDKNWIFYDTQTGMRAHGEKFAKYTLMGGATTLIFWGVEFLFHLLSDAEFMKYLGGLIGLSIGYVIKYWLDRRFVFQSATA